MMSDWQIELPDQVNLSELSEFIIYVYVIGRKEGRKDKRYLRYHEIKIQKKESELIEIEREREVL